MNSLIKIMNQQMESNGEDDTVILNGVSSTQDNKKRDNQKCYWCFTYNNFTLESVEIMESIFKHECDWYIFQEETGEQGTVHLQGTLKFKGRGKRFSEIKKIDKNISWSVTKAIKSSIVYCSKEATRTGKQWVFGIEIPEEIEVDEPYGWQLEIMDIIKNKPDKRTINWFWEPDGNVGKTALCKYLVTKHNALMLNGKSSDMFHMISKFPNKRKIILIDVPRKQQDFVNYGAIEQIKNGLIFSGKYEGTQIVFNCPHVFVFNNQLPDFPSLSIDRWNVKRILI